MFLRPVEKRQLKLRHALEQIREVAALAHLGGHVGAHLGDALIARVGLVAHQQVQLGVFLDLHAQLIQALDGGVAGEEVLGTGAEGDDLEVLHADDGAGDGVELLDHSADVPGGADGVLGDIAPEMAHAEVIRAVEHTAVGVAAAIDKVSVPLGGGHEHAGAVKVFGDEGLGRLGAEVAEEDDQGVAARGLHVFDRFEHVLLVFHRDGTFIDIAAAGFDDGLAPGDRQADGEAVAGDGNDAELDFGDVLHFCFLLSEAPGTRP